MCIFIAMINIRTGKSHAGYRAGCVPANRTCADILTGKSYGTGGSHGTTLQRKFTLATMADAGPPKKVRKKLPPLDKKEDDFEGEKKPVRKKKKKPAESKTNEETPKEITSKATDGTPRKKKKPATPKDTGGPVENGATSPEAKPTPRKRKKKKPAEEQEGGEPTSARSAGSQQGEDVAGSKTSLITKEQDASTPKKKVKKKVKKTPRTTTPTREEDEFLDANFAADLTTIQEDIVMPSTGRKDGEGDDDNEEEEEVRRHHPYSTESNVLKSQPLQKLFVETDSGFRGQDKARLARKLAEEEAYKSSLPQKQQRTTIELALETQNLLKTLSLFVHGVTAGISVWQITVTYILLNFTYTDFILHYQDLALPVQCMFYILLLLCTLSACDRFDIGHITRQFLIHSLTLQTGTIAVFIYAAALITSLCTIQYEDKMHLFGNNITLWNNTEAIRSEMTTWQNLNTARCALAILGWIVISIKPNADRLAENLKQGEDNILGTQVELTASKA